MRALRVLAAAAALAVAGGTARADERATAEPVHPVERAFVHPKATGLLALTTLPDSQARTAGILPGDILVAYDGSPTPKNDDLRRLIAATAAEGKKESVVADLVSPDGAKRSVTLRPGRIGVTLREVVGGQGVEPLPPGTDPRLDLARCATANADLWYALALTDMGKRGFDHARTRFADGRLTVDREVAFDGADRFGRMQSLVSIVAEVREGAALPQLRTVRFENPLRKYVGEGRVESGAGDARRWTFVGRVGEDSQTKGDALPRDLVVPQFLLETLVCAMPREKGACLRLIELQEDSGELLLPAALVCVGDEDVRVGEKSVKAWRYDVRRLGGATTSFWVDAEHRLVRGDYGGAVTTLATKAEALAGLHPEITPKTAD